MLPLLIFSVHSIHNIYYYLILQGKNTGNKMKKLSKLKPKSAAWKVKILKSQESKCFLQLSHKKLGNEMIKLKKQSILHLVGYLDICLKSTQHTVEF